MWQPCFVEKQRLLGVTAFAVFAILGIFAIPAGGGGGGGGGGGAAVTEAGVGALQLVAAPPGGLRGVAAQVAIESKT